MMRLVVFSHKEVWHSGEGGKLCCDGGFPLQMRALSELFEETTICVPVIDGKGRAGGMTLDGHNLRVAPLVPPMGKGWLRKALFPLWLARNLRRMLRELARANGVHCPIPGDVGTAGMILAACCRKPLFVRHCGNWERQMTLAEHFWRWFMVRFNGGRNVMVATGLDDGGSCGQGVQWIFSTSLREADLRCLGQVRGAPDPEGGTLAIACRQTREKGTALVIRALRLVRERRPGIRLLVMGAGPELDSLRGLAVAEGVRDRVEFTGQLPQSLVLERLRECDLFVFPTTASEGFPKAAVEALACGLPLVCSSTSVLPRLVRDGAGVSIDHLSAESVASAVEECLRPGVYEAMSARALEKAREYTLEAWQSAITELLQKSWKPHGF